LKNIHKLEKHRNTEGGVFDPFLDNVQLHNIVATAIGRIGDSIHIPVLERLIQSDNFIVRQNAIFALGQIDYLRSRELLERLLKDSSYSINTRQILAALGINGTSQSLRSINSFLEISPDSIKAFTIRILANLSRKTQNDSRTRPLILPFLDSDDQAIREAAAYYFSRNPSRNSVRPLITANFPDESLGNKYRYTALEKIYQKFKTLSTDSTLIDTLKDELYQNLNIKEIPWQTKLPLLGLMPIFEDSITIKKAATFLRDSIAHVRLKTIRVLGKWKNQYVQSILLNYYQNGTWIEKGHIIREIAAIDSRFTYRLIQQNLDRGTVHFKELLLQSLAIINRRQSIGLLRQFLNVPNRRLNYVAFKELADRKRIRSDDIPIVLESGDPALITAAAEWALKNPSTISVSEIKKSYSMLKEPDGLEAMVALMRVIGLKKPENETVFLMNSLQKAKSNELYQQICKNMISMGVSVPDTIVAGIKLYVTDSLITEDVVSVLVKTQKGDIELELWTKVAPFTVSNFFKLVASGFYKGLKFHRVVADFVVQGGDPRGDGWGGPGYYIPCEYSDRPYNRGSIGIATAGKDTGGCQFFICHSEQPHLNGRYTLFGTVVRGMTVVDQLEKDDTILNIIILK
jgi:peptidylprolyl isomerase